MDLVILAAGMGSRFGGLKQLEPIDDYKDFIIDYSIYDAIEAGFDRVIFIIRKENEKIFKETIGNRIGRKVKVQYVFQENDSVPDVRIPSDRKKPLGTGHAILCCRDVVDGPFMIINADDFYGKGSYKLVVDFIKTQCDDRTFGCVAYEAGKTMTENGKVKRGICDVKDGNIVGICESSISHRADGDVDAEPLDGSPSFVIPQDKPVSMNMFILSPSIFGVLDKGFHEFLSSWEDDLKDEFLLPDIISKTVGEGEAVLKPVISDEVWYGITYPDDKQGVVDSIASMVASGKYPPGLWN